MVYHVEIYPISEVPEEIKEIIYQDMETIPQNSNADFSELYEEQLLYINAENPGSYFLAAFNNEVYLGGVCLFLDTGLEKKSDIIIDTPSPGFQAIAKSQAGLRDPVKLNSLLIPAIAGFLRSLGYTRVHVNPLPNQRKILLTHYGFYPDPVHEGTLILNF